MPHMMPLIWIFLFVLFWLLLIYIILLWYYSWCIVLECFQFLFKTSNYNIEW